MGHVRRYPKGPQMQSNAGQAKDRRKATPKMQA
jgi:hypothetical protein